MGITFEDQAFEAKMMGVFHSFRLYDEKGGECFTLEDAKQAADDVYPDCDIEVYNGQIGATRVSGAWD